MPIWTEGGLVPVKFDREVSAILAWPDSRCAARTAGHTLLEVLPRRAGLGFLSWNGTDAYRIDETSLHGRSHSNCEGLANRPDAGVRAH